MLRYYIDAVALFLVVPYRSEFGYRLCRSLSGTQDHVREESMLRLISVCTFRPLEVGEREC